MYPDRVISFTFDHITIFQAVSILNEREGLNLFYAPELSGNIISYSCDNLCIDDALRQMCHLNGLSLSVYDRFYYISDKSSDGLITQVYRMFGDFDNFKTMLESLGGEDCKVNYCGSVAVVTADYAKHKQINDLIETLRYNCNQSYLAEIYFLRLKRKDYLDLSADLQTRNIDLLSGGFDLSDLFSAYLRADCNRGSNTVDQRPVIYLTDGQTSVVNVGSEIVRSERSLSSEGVSSVTGYKSFTDGLDLTLTPYKIDSDTLTLDVSLSVSTFDQSDSDSDVPRSDKTKIESKGQVIRDGAIVYLGSVDRRDSNKGFRLFGGVVNNNADVLSVWLRVRSIE